MFFFFSSRRRHTRCLSDWNSDVCSSDLELRPWAEDLLAASSLRQEGFFAERTVRQRWQDHVTRQRDWGGPLWNVLMFISRSEERRVGKECRSRLSTYH